MELSPDTPRVERTIADIKVQVPQPYAEGQPLTAATAAMLNQTFAENISNNTRERLKAGYVASEGAEAQPHTAESAQAVIDSYVADYEPGVRRGGGGEPRVTDPVEREARAIAREKAKELVKAANMKTTDVDMGELTSKVFEANKELLMAEGKKIVKAKEAAAGKSDALDFTGIDLTPKAATLEGEEAAAA